MWLPKPIANQTLPDATLGTSNTYPESKINHYNLRDHERKVQPTPVRNRPERTVGKPMTYAEPTDDSSQDSKSLVLCTHWIADLLRTPKLKKSSA